MTEINVSSNSSSNFEKLSPESARINETSKTSNVAEALDLLQDSNLTGALSLFAKTGLPEVFNAKLLQEFLTDPKTVQSFENFASSYRDLTDHLSESQLQDTFREFSEDQLVSKGYFSPMEAFAEWGDYVRDRERTARNMGIVANNLVASQPKSATGTSSIDAHNALSYMSKLMDMLIKMSGTMQEIGMTQSKELELETSRQEAYLDIQKCLQSISPNIGWFQKADKAETIKAVDLWNQTILPNYQEKNRSFKEASQEKAKQINANINRTVQLAQKLSDDFADLLSKLTSMGMAIIR